MRELIPKLEAAARLNVSVSTLNRWARQGFGPKPVKVGQRAVRYLATDIDAWIVSRGAA